MISPEQAQFLWRTSWISLGSTLYALYRGHYALAPVPGGVFLTSINYWGSLAQPGRDRSLADSWKRHIDMTYVIAAFLYQSFLAREAEYAMAYYLLSSIGLASYPIGWVAYLRGHIWMSVYIHSIIHVVGNLANVTLYSGCVYTCPQSLLDGKDI